jgi:iron complex transport system substrate-binding protein
VLGGFSTVDAGRVAALAPDLVICFSDVQAEIAAQLIRRGCTVLATNQRTLAEIAEAIRLIGRAIGRALGGERLADEFLDGVKALADAAGPQPRVYFEEWPDPLISGIGWVGELIEQCGGVDVFASRRGRPSRERSVTIEEVIEANPEIILASWCGRRVDIAAIRARPGFSTIRAVQEDEIHTIDSGLLLQPGPAVLNGARELKRIIAAWRRRACIPADAHPR